MLLGKFGTLRPKPEQNSQWEAGEFGQDVQESDGGTRDPGDLV